MTESTDDNRRDEDSSSDSRWDELLSRLPPPDTGKLSDEQLFAVYKLFAPSLTPNFEQFVRPLIKYLRK